VSKPIERALDNIPNRFLLTTVVARRWESMVAGLPPLVEVAPGTSRLAIALQEVLEERVTVNHDTAEIELHGQPLEEENDETLFSEAFSPDADSVKEILGDQ
jgi:DNA-directed RNA polymerase subunit K/omega